MTRSSERNWYNEMVGLEMGLIPETGKVRSNFEEEPEDVEDTEEELVGEA